MHGYSTEKKQRTKMGTSYSSLGDIMIGVLQGSILVLLLFNLSLCDLFLLMEDTDFASKISLVSSAWLEPDILAPLLGNNKGWKTSMHVDDNTLYISSDGIDQVA